MVQARAVGARVAVAVVAVALLAPRLALGDSDDDRRLRMGALVLRQLLTADVEVAQRVASDGQLWVAVLGEPKSRWADEAKAALERGTSAEPGGFNGLPIAVVVTDDPGFADLAVPPAAIFVGCKLEDREREQLVRYGIEKRLIVFSPFEGDVEKGVLGGLVVGAQVRLLLNMSTLRSSRVVLKPKLLRVAKVVDG